MNQKVENFIERHKLSPENVNAQELISHIISEMDAALAGKKSSMPMIDSMINCNYEINSTEKVIVIDAGGTNLRTCIVTVQGDSTPLISDFRKNRMPGSQSAVSASQFFSLLADEVEPLIEKSNRIGFCFSYPTEIFKSSYGIDGKLMFFSKEIEAQEVVGKKIGKELLDELSRRGHDVHGKKLCLLNDTVATLLAGLPSNKSTGTEGCVGIILGTGSNQAYIEGGKTIINEEAGCFDFRLGDIDEEYQSTTKKPDDYRFEKMISGAYLGPKALMIMQKAKDEGVLSATFTIPETFDTIALSTVLEGDFSAFGNFTGSDASALSDIFPEYVKRSAKLTATSLAASVLKSNYGTEKPVLINVDGTTYYKTKYLKEFTEKYLNEILSFYGRSAVFIGTENAPVIGSAIGALSLH